MKRESDGWTPLPLPGCVIRSFHVILSSWLVYLHGSHWPVWILLYCLAEGKLPAETVPNSPILLLQCLMPRCSNRSKQTLHFKQWHKLHDWPFLLQHLEDKTLEKGQEIKEELFWPVTMANLSSEKNRKTAGIILPQPKQASSRSLRSAEQVTRPLVLYVQSMKRAAPAPLSVEAVASISPINDYLTGKPHRYIFSRRVVCRSKSKRRSRIQRNVGA